MSELSEEERHVMEHAYGWRSKNPGYRNYYSADEECDSWPTCMGLVARGLMGKRGPRHDISPYSIFFLTEAGVAALRGAP